jgi:hypothetical protein
MNQYKILSEDKELDIIEAKTGKEAIEKFAQNSLMVHFLSLYSQKAGKNIRNCTISAKKL